MRQLSDAALKRLLWLMVGIMVLLYGALVIIAYLDIRAGVQHLPSWGFPGGPLPVSYVAGASSSSVVSMAVGVLITRRQPRNLIGWLMLASGILNLVDYLGQLYADFAILYPPSGLPFGEVVAVAQNQVYPWAFLVGIYLPLLLFPDGRLLSTRWRWMIWLNVLAAAFTTFTTVTMPGPLLNAQYLDTPLGLEWVGNNRSWLEGLSVALSVSGLGAALIALIVRWRRAEGVARDPFRWLALVGVFTLLLTAIPLALDVLLGPLPWWLQLLPALTPMILPIGFAIAILRYRTWDVNVVIRRTLIYGVLTAILGVVYFGGVTLLQTLFADLIGSESTLAVVISTLVIAALFRPLQVRIQRFIDRRFYRQNYDAAQTLEAFADTVRDEIAVEDVEAALLTAINETMQPESVGLWIREGGS